jgi:hypothetical protein
MARPAKIETDKLNIQRFVNNPELLKQKRGFYTKNYVSGNAIIFDACEPA